MKSIDLVKNKAIGIFDDEVSIVCIEVGKQHKETKIKVVSGYSNDIATAYFEDPNTVRQIAQTLLQAADWMEGK